MSKIFFLIALLSFCKYSVAQNRQKVVVNTMSLAGKYEYGKTAEKEEVGFAYIYAESDSTILFYLDLNAGPPSLSMGSIYGRVKIKKHNGLFVTSLDDSKDSCKFLLKFKKDMLLIETVNSQYNCGFGHRVFADGRFKRISRKNPSYFFNSEGNKEYFKNLKL